MNKIIELFQKIKQSPNRDNYVIGLIMAWAIFLISYVTFVEYKNNYALAIFVLMCVVGIGIYGIKKK